MQGWGTVGRECGERISLLPRWPSMGAHGGHGRAPAHVTCCRSCSPAGGRDGFLCGSFVPSRRLTGPEFSRRDSLAREDVLAPSTGRALGPGREDSQLLADQTEDAPPPHKAPSAHPQTEFAKCSSKAINTVQGEFPQLFLNKTHSGGLVYSQTAGSVNDPSPGCPSPRWRLIKI